MHAKDIEIREIDDRVELSALVEFETIDPGSKRFWFRLPADLATPDRFGDTLLAALLVPAMSLGERLRIDAPVSRPVLAAATEVLTPVLRRWKWDQKKIAIECDVEDWIASTTKPRSHGAFFSGGVDSWYSVLKHRASLDHLVFVRGIEISNRESPQWTAALELNRESATILGKELIVVETNIHDIALREVPRRAEVLGQRYYSYSIQRYSGCMLASIAFLLQRTLGRATIASTFAFERLDPEGSHFLLEPAWSSDVLRFDLDGGEAGRPEKIEAIARWMPGALARLRVCFSRDRIALNCGECDKCLRTLLSMRATGTLNLATSFAQPPNLRKMRIALTHAYVWSEVRDAAARNGDDQLTRAIERELVFAKCRAFMDRMVSPVYHLYRETRRLLRPIRAALR